MSEEVKKEFLNLDLLKADKSRRVLFLGKEFELSYIPCGIAVPLIETHNAQIKQELNEKGEVKNQEVMIQVELKMVSLFCGFYEKEFTEEYIAKNATDKQLFAMYTYILNSIAENFSILSDAENPQSKKKQTGGS